MEQNSTKYQSPTTPPCVVIGNISVNPDNVIRNISLEKACELNLQAGHCQLPGEQSYILPGDDVVEIQCSSNTSETWDDLVYRVAGIRKFITYLHLRAFEGLVESASVNLGYYQMRIDQMKFNNRKIEDVIRDIKNSSCD